MQQLIIKTTGLNTNPSPFGTKEGGLSMARNVNVNSPNIVTTRRGFTNYGLTNGGGIDVLVKMFEYKDRILQYHDNEKISYDSDDAGTWVQYNGTFTEVDSTIGITGFKSNGSLFINTATGVKKLESLTSQWTSAGGIKAIGADAALTGSTGFLPDNKQIAYRIVWGSTDINEIVTLGAPSERIEVINTDDSGSVPSDVNLTIYIPDGITTSHFYQVYRSGFSTNADTIANDELQLVYEDFPTSAEIAAGSLSFTDITPNSLRGATIYTAASQEGILQSNDIPPVAKDVAVYKNYALYANTKTTHRFYLTLLASGSTNGVGIGDVITIDGDAYTGAAAQDHSVAEFKIFDTGDAAGDIANTAKSLVQVINRYDTNTTITAYYISGFDDLPGKMLFEARSASGSSFTISFVGLTGPDSSVAWNPTLTAAKTSENEAKTHRVYISKVNQFDAVPILNYIDVGSGNSEIKRIIALRDSVFIFKDDGELYRLVGDVIDNFVVSLFDNTTTLLVPRTAVPFNNQIYAFADQGVVAVSDTGVSIKSWDIQETIRNLVNSEAFAIVGQAAAYESENQYVLYAGILDQADQTRETFVYNTLTNSWTTWTHPNGMTSLFLRPSNDKIYFSTGNGFIKQENKGSLHRDYISDYADDRVTLSLTSFSGKVLTFADASDVSAGDWICNVRTSVDIVSEVISVDGNDVTVADTFTNWIDSNIFSGTGIATKVKYLPIYTENPGMVKRFRELSAFFEKRISKLTMLFSNNFEEETTTSLALTDSNTTIGSSTTFRTLFPISLQRALWQILEFQTANGFSRMGMNGLSIQFEESDARFIT